MIDVDVHAIVSSIADARAVSRRALARGVATSQFAGPTDKAHPPNLATSSRPDLAPVADQPPGRRSRRFRPAARPARSSPRDPQLRLRVESIRNPDAAAALASAVNDWQIAEWLERDPRLRAAIVVPSGQPEMARRGVERAGEHPSFVAVYLPVRSAVPYGNRSPVAAAGGGLRAGLVVELHFGGAIRAAPDRPGWPTTWLEEYVDMASASSRN